MSGNAPNEIDEMIKQIKSRAGFSAYVIMSNDGIVVKYENMEYREAVMYAYHVLDLHARTRKHLSKLMISDTQDNELEWIRLKTQIHEMIIAPYLKFTIVVLQTPKAVEKEIESEIQRKKSVIEEEQTKEKDEKIPLTNVS